MNSHTGGFPVRFTFFFLFGVLILHIMSYACLNRSINTGSDHSKNEDSLQSLSFTRKSQWSVRLSQYGFRQRESFISIDSRVPLKDPAYASYYGGSGHEGGGFITRTSDSRIILAGATSSTQLPHSCLSSYDSLRGAFDCFISYWSGDARVLLCSWILGGSDEDAITSASLFPDGGIVVAGYTTSRDFPVSTNVVQTSYGGGDVDGFIAFIDSSGTRIRFATYIGGRGIDEVTDVAVGKDGTIYAVGYTDSYSSFPRTADAMQRIYGGGEDDMFIIALDSSGSVLKYGSFYGGNGFDEASSLSITADGEIVIGGLTSSSNLVTSIDALQKQKLGDEDGFVLTLDSTLKQRRFASYFGGTGNETIIKVLTSGGARYVIGRTTSRDLPTTKGVVQEKKAEPNGPNESIDTFVLCMSVHPSHIEFLTYFGGESQDEIEDAAVLDTFIVLAGSTTSSYYPCTESAAKKVKHGYFDGVLTVIDRTGTQVLYSSYIGGTDDDGINAISQPEGERHILATGFTTSTNFSITSDAVQSINAGGNDVFLIVYNLDGLVGGIDEQAEPSVHASPAFLSITPHPFGKAGYTVSYRVSVGGETQLTLYDALGRKVEQRVQQSVSGTQTVHFDMHGAPPGVYHLVLESGGSRTARIVIKRE